MQDSSSSLFFLVSYFGERPWWPIQCLKNGRKKKANLKSLNILVALPINIEWLVSPSLAVCYTLPSCLYFTPNKAVIFSYISYLILLRRVALQHKLTFKGPSNNNISYNL